MRAKLKIGMLCVLTTVVSFAIFAGQARERVKDGVNVVVERGTDSFKGFRAFNVRAVNVGDGPRSVNMKIYLNKSRVKEPKGHRGSCTVFISLPAGASKSVVKQCKEKRKSNQWTFNLIKVYKFLLN